MVKAKEKVKTVLDAFRNKAEISAVKYYKAGLRAMHVEELRKEKGKEFALLEDKDLSTLEKLAILRDLQAELYKKEGYEGSLPGLYVTDGPNSFAVDGKDGKGKRIFISVQDLESGKGLASLYAHENVHLYSGYENGEHLAEYGEAKVSKESSKETFTEEERRLYLEKVKGRIDQTESLEKQFAMAKEVLEENRENFYDKETHKKYIKPNFSKEEIAIFAKKYGISEKEVVENPTKYAYYEALANKNIEFKNEKEFLKYQESLVQKIKEEKNEERKRELEKSLYTEVEDTAALYHNIQLNQNGNPYIDINFPNKKYINANGQEAVFNKKQESGLRMESMMQHIILQGWMKL